MRLSVTKLRQILQITPKVSLVDENIKILVEHTKPYSKGKKTGIKVKETGKDKL